MIIAVFLIIVSVISLNISNEFQNKIKENIAVNIFLTDSLNDSSVNNLQNELAAKPFINSIKYINKEKAAEIFVKQTGEDFRSLLDYNPLPASFVITLKEDYVQQDSMAQIVTSISRNKIVDEVVYQTSSVEKILSIIKSVKKYLLAAAVTILFISLYLVYSTVKLITKTKYPELETMKLVGAKLSTIKMPIILNGVLIGFIAGLVSITIFILFIYYSHSYIMVLNFLKVDNYFYLIIFILIGPLIGLLVSIFSLRKITLKV